MEKEYFIRIYIFSEDSGIIVNDAIDADLFEVTQSFDGVNGCLAIYDVRMSKSGLKCLLLMDVDYLPLNNYGDFKITCPNCGERIDDDMILTIYDETMLSGYNILCNRHDCGFQVAKVEYIGD